MRTLLLCLRKKNFNHINVLVNSLQFSQVTYHLLKINSFYSELKQNDVTLIIMGILHTVNDEEKTKILTSLCTCSNEGLTLKMSALKISMVANSHYQLSR